MARYTGPKVRVSRRLGTNIFENEKGRKALERRPFPPGQHGRTRRRNAGSEYLAQLQEKQKAKYIYGVLERQFRRTYEEAMPLSIDYSFMAVPINEGGGQWRPMGQRSRRVPGAPTKGMHCVSCVYTVPVHGSEAGFNIRLGVAAFALACFPSGTLKRPGQRADCRRSNVEGMLM